MPMTNAAIQAVMYVRRFSTTLFPQFIHTENLKELEVESLVFQPFFTVQIPPLMEVMTALVLAFLMGLGIAVIKSPVLQKAFQELQAIVVMAIEKVVIPLLPIYIFGLFLDMSAAVRWLQCWRPSLPSLPLSLS